MRLATLRTGIAVAVMFLCSLPSSAGATGPEPEAKPEPAGPSAEPSPPPEDAPAELRADYWFGRGEALGEAGDFVGAAKAFERSVEVMRTAEGLYNRAVAYEYASMFLEAHAAYEDYGEFVEPRSAEARTADEAIKRMESRVGRIELGFAKDHEPENIYVDGDPRSADEFPLLVMPGEHEVVVVEQGGEPTRRSSRLEAGGVWTVDFARPNPVPVEGPTFKPRPAFDEFEREGRRRIVRSLFYTSVGLTAAAGVTLGVFGGMTVREANAFEAAQCGTQPNCDSAGFPDYPADHERKFENYKLATNVMVGATAGLAGITLVLGVVGFSRPKSEKAEATARVRFEPAALRMHF